MSSGIVGTKTSGKAKLFTGVSLAALALCCWPPSAATAREYRVGNETELRNAITTANGDGDAGATIVMTGSFSISTAVMPVPAKPITIDTNGFVLTNTYDPAAGSSRGTITIQHSSGALVPVTFSGTLVAANAGAAATTAGQNGVVLTATAFTNSGSITAGDGGGGGGALASGGVGIRATVGSSMTNNGTITGGNSTSTAGGVGVDFGSPTGGPGTLINSGTIRGGNGPTNGTGSNGAGVILRAVAWQLINSGTIEGGTGAVAVISGPAANPNLDLIK